MSDTNYPLHLLAAYQQFYPNVIPDWVVKAPDYEVWAAASRLDVAEFNIVNANVRARTAFSWQSAKVKRTVFRRPLPAWARYPAGVIFYMCADGLDRRGIYAALLTTETARVRTEYGSGIAMAALWHTLAGRSYTPDSLRELVEKVRREYILEV